MKSRLQVEPNDETGVIYKKSTESVEHIINGQPPPTPTYILFLPHNTAKTQRALPPSNPNPHQPQLS